MENETVFNEFMIVVNGVDCDNEQMPLSNFMESNSDFPISDLVNILNLKIGEIWHCPGYAPGCDFTVKRIENVDWHDRNIAPE